MHVSLGRFHVAVYLDGSSLNPLLNPDAEDAQSASLRKEYERQRRFDSVDLDRRRWTSTHGATLGRQF